MTTKRTPQGKPSYYTDLSGTINQPNAAIDRLRDQHILDENNRRFNNHGGREDGAYSLLSPAEAQEILNRNNRTAPRRRLMQQGGSNATAELESKIQEMQINFQMKINDEMVEFKNTMSMQLAEISQALNNIAATVKSNPATATEQPTINQQRRATQAEYTDDSEIELHYPTATSNQYRNARPRRLPSRQAESTAGISENERDENRSTTQKKQSIDKWGITYDGNENKTTIDDFLFRLEYLQQWHRKPWGDIVGEFHKLVEGKARDWYWNHLRMHGAEDWWALKRAMKRQFSSRQTDFEIMQQMMERTQKYNESIEEFLQVQTKLRARLQNGIPEKEMVKIIKKNIKENVGKIIYPMTIETVEQLRHEYNDVERTFGNRHQQKSSFQPSNNRHAMRAQISEVQNDWSDWQEEAEDLEYVEEVQHRPAFKCWNCGDGGHNYLECPKQRKIFCYKCGRPNVITTKCPNCKGQGNSRQSAVRASVSCSTQTQTESARNT